MTFLLFKKEQNFLAFDDMIIALNIKRNILVSVLRTVKIN